MTAPDMSVIADPTRPRPVRIAAFVGAFLQGVLATLAIALKLDPALVGSILASLTLVNLAGWLFVEQQVTPLRDPAVQQDGKLVSLTPATVPGPSLGQEPDFPGGFGTS